MRLYHPQLGQEIDHPDDEASLAVMYKSGWKPALEPKSDDPALAPEPTVYEPVKSAKSAKKAESTDK